MFVDPSLNEGDVFARAADFEFATQLVEFATPLNIPWENPKCQFARDLFLIAHSLVWTSQTSSQEWLILPTNRSAFRRFSIARFVLLMSALTMGSRKFPVFFGTQTSVMFVYVFE
jgi:hypothetical protein